MNKEWSYILIPYNSQLQNRSIKFGLIWSCKNCLQRLLEMTMRVHSLKDEWMWGSRQKKEGMKQDRLDEGRNGPGGLLREESLF